MLTQPKIEDAREFNHRFRDSYFGLYSKRTELIYPFMCDGVAAGGNTPVSKMGTWAIAGHYLRPLKGKERRLSVPKPVNMTFEELSKEHGLLPVFDLPPQGYRQITYLGTRQTGVIKPEVCVYFSRQPRRQYRMGAAPRAYRCSVSGASELRQFKLNTNARHVVGNSFTNNNNLFAFFNPEFYSYDEAVRQIEAGEALSACFSLSWAVRVSLRHPRLLLEYKGVPVGALTVEGRPVLNADQNHLQESLMEAIEESNQ